MTFISHEIYYYCTIISLQYTYLFIFFRRRKSIELNLCLSEFDLTIKWLPVSDAFGAPFNDNEMEGNLSFHHHLHSRKI